MNREMGRIGSAGKTHKYNELADHFRRQIENGELCPGEKLPSFGSMLSAHGIGQATLDRVYNILEEEGLVARHPGRGTFVADPKGRQLPHRNAIGIIWRQLATYDPYVSQLLMGIQSATLKSGYETLFVHDVAAVSWDKVSGVITTESDRKTLGNLPKGMPNVALWTPHEGLPSVTTDDYQGIRDAILYLLEQGHRRIGFLTVGCQKNSDYLSRRRLQAYFDTLKTAGIVLATNWTRPLFDPLDIIYGTDSFRDYGRKKMNEWLRHGWTDLGCTALLAQNDDTAIGAIQALQQAGFKVPQDISVVGFDGTERAEYFSPCVTTVRVPLQSLSVASVDLLIELIEAQRKGMKPEMNRQVVLPTTFSVGGSTGPANGDSGEDFKRQMLPVSTGGK